MNFSYDSQVDTLDIRVRDGALVARTEQLDTGTLVDVDERGNVVSIEIIHPARRWPLDEILERFTMDEESAEVLRSLWREPNSYPFNKPTELSAGELVGT